MVAVIATVSYESAYQVTGISEWVFPVWISIVAPFVIYDIWMNFYMAHRAEKLLRHMLSGDRYPLTQSSSDKAKRDELLQLISRVSHRDFLTRFLELAWRAANHGDYQFSAAIFYRTVKLLEKLVLFRKYFANRIYDEHYLGEADHYLAQTLFLWSSSCAMEGKLEGSLELCEKAQKQFRALEGDHSDKVMECRMRRASLMARLEKPKDDVLELANDIHADLWQDRSQWARAERFMGNIYLMMGDLDKALEFFEGAVRSAGDDSHVPTDLRLEDLFNLGYAYSLLGSHQKSIWPYKRSLELYAENEVDDLPLKYRLFFELGRALNATGESGASVQYYEQIPFEVLMRFNEEADEASEDEDTYGE